MKDKMGPRVNGQIIAKMVRLIDIDGEVVGVISTQDAIRRAKSHNLDLVEIAPDSDPPVCKIIDYSKYRYELKKRKNDSQKKSKKSTLKEIKFKVNIAPGDFTVKVNKIKQLIKGGDKVKVSLWFKGREIIHKDHGEKLFTDIINALEGEATVESQPKFEGKYGSMILA